MLKITLVVLLGLFSTSFALECKSTPSLPGFTIDRLYGNWFEIQRIPQDYQRNLFCGSAIYGNFNNNGDVVYTYSHFHYTRGTSRLSQNSGFMSTIGANNELQISFGKVINSLPPFVNYNYNVWSFDYDNYMLVYTCDGQNEYATIFSRGKTLSLSTLQSLRNLLAEKGVDISKLENARVQCPS